MTNLNEIAEKAEKLAGKIDMTELHKALVFSGANDNVTIWMDGTFDVLSSNTSPNTEEEYITLKAWGIGNTESGNYSEGFYTQTDEQSDNGLFLNPETGKELTSEEMITECIEDGCWDDFASDIENQIKIEMEAAAYYY